MGNKQKGKIQKIVNTDTFDKIKHESRNKTKSRQEASAMRDDNVKMHKANNSIMFQQSREYKAEQAKIVKANKERRLQKYGSL